MKNQTIKCVGVVVKPNHAQAWQTARELSDWLKGRAISTVSLACDESKNVAIECVGVEEFKRAVDLIVVLGGDGTMISTAPLIDNRAVPVLGINYGYLGYLTEFRMEEMFPALEAILAGEYEIDSRVMLEVEHFRRGKPIESGRVLNDVVVNKAVLARMIDIEIRLNDLFVNSFRADGLIVSTPTGSTAYNLSAGGPIVYPSMNAVVLTPICPFTLTNRPIVVPDTDEINLRLTQKSEGVVITLDGHIGYSMTAGDTVSIRKSATNFNLVQPPNRNYFDVLRDKLKWGR